MQVAMLGPLEVRTDDDSGIVLDVGGSRLRALQALVVIPRADDPPAEPPRLAQPAPAAPVADTERLKLPELTALAGLADLALRGQSVTMDILAALVPQSHPAPER